MSASEWLHSIFFLLITIVTLNVLAGIPTKKAKEKSDYKAHFKKTSKIIYYSIASILVLTAFATLLPIYWLLTGFLVFVSQMTLSICLTLLAIICLIRIVRSGNILELLLIKVARVIYFCLYPVITFFIVATPSLIRFASDVASDYVEQSEKDAEEKRRKEIGKMRINYNGEFSGCDDINKYT